MPLVGGNLTWRERKFISALVETCGEDIPAVARVADLPYHTAYRISQRPDVQAAIVARQRALMVAELLPLSVAAQRDMLTNPKTPASVRRAVALDVQNRVFGEDRAGGGVLKDPHEMTPDELAAAISQLETLAASKAKEITPQASIEAAPRPSILD